MAQDPRTLNLKHLALDPQPYSLKPPNPQAGLHCARAMLEMRSSEHRRPNIWGTPGRLFWRSLLGNISGMFGGIPQITLGRFRKVQLCRFSRLECQGDLASRKYTYPTALLKCPCPSKGRLRRNRLSATSCTSF